MGGDRKPSGGGTRLLNRRDALEIMAGNRWDGMRPKTSQSGNPLTWISSVEG